MSLRSLLKAATLLKPETTDTSAAGAYAPPRGNRVAFLGDSITSSVVSSTNYQDTFPTYAAAALLGQAVVPVIAGVAGQRSDQMLARFDTDITPYAPQYVVILAGTNDTGQSVALTTFQANMRAIVAKCFAIGAKPILCSIPPNSTGLPAGRAQLITQYNAWLRRWAIANRYELVDFYTALVDPATGNYRAGFSTDGTHPNPPKAQVLGQLVASQIKSLLAGTMPLMVADANDPNNLCKNGLFLTNSAGQASFISAFGSGATYTIDSSDATIQGNWQNVAVSNTGSTGFTTGVQGTLPNTGDIVAVSCLVKASPGPTSGRFAVSLQSLTSGFAVASESKWSGISQPLTKSVFYAEVVWPATGAIKPCIQIVHQGDTTGSFGIAQVGIYNLTALGIATP